MLAISQQIQLLFLFAMKAKYRIKFHLASYSIVYLDVYIRFIQFEQKFIHFLKEVSLENHLGANILSLLCIHQ